MHMTDKRLLSEYMCKRLYDDNSDISIWGKSILHSYERVSRLAFLPLLTWTSARDCIVFGSRIYSKLSEDGRSQSHVVLSARDIARMPVIPSSFSYDLQSYRAVCRAVTNRNDEVLDRLMSRIRNTLKIVHPRLFVANSTIDPINRLWIHAAKEYGAKVACLQHGVYSREIPDYAQEDDIVDSYIALDDSQKAIVARNIDSQKIVVLGRQSQFAWKTPGKSISVCFVGEDWERYGYVELKQMIVARYLDIGVALASIGVGASWYKPHPSEERMFGIDDKLRILPKNNINVPDVYIGFSSSFLKDVSSRGKLAIQILEPKTNADCFQNNGYCLSVANDEDLVDNVLRILQSDQTPPCIHEQKLDSLLELT